MKSLLFICLLSSLTLVLAGCFECRNDDCPAHEEFKFQLFDVNGKSLTDETESIGLLDNDSIEVLGVSNIERTSVDVVLRGSTLFLTPSNSFEFYLIEYSFAKDDTLEFDLTIYNDDCCSNVVSEFMVKINSSKTSISSLSDSTFVFIK